MKKIMISGSRTINDESLISEKLNSALAEYPDMILISGGARGVDSIGEAWAKSHNVQIQQYKPDWKRYGRGAGIVRNKSMVETADLVIIFWDGISKGTKSVIDFCKKRNKSYLLVEIKNEK